jgi:molybdopterin-guanine dinucleotide biosynthesis protein B
MTRKRWKMVPVIAFVGRHNSGKTTVLAKVIHNFQMKGIKTGVIKHSHHSPTPDNHDSGKLFAAGAQQVFLSTPHESLLYIRQGEKSLEKIIEQVAPQVDLILLEGYKRSNYPKIEVVRQAVDANPLEVDHVIARITDCDFKDKLPQFGFGQEDKLVEFLIEKFFSADANG